MKKEILVVMKKKKISDGNRSVVKVIKKLNYGREKVVVRRKQKKIKIKMRKTTKMKTKTKERLVFT